MTLMPPNGRDLSPDQLGELKEKQRRKGYDKTATQQQAENEAAVNSLYASLGGNSAPSSSNQPYRPRVDPIIAPPYVAG